VRDQFHRDIIPKDPLLNRVTNHDLELDERRAAGVSGLFGEYLRTCSCASTLRCLGFAVPNSHSDPKHVAPWYQPSSSRGNPNHGVCEFQLDLPAKGIDQIILGLEVRKQSSLGDASLF
jgi:hypothetical protein